MEEQKQPSKMATTEEMNEEIEQLKKQCERLTDAILEIRDHINDTRLYDTINRIIYKP